MSRKIKALAFSIPQMFLTFWAILLLDFDGYFKVTVGRDFFNSSKGYMDYERRNHVRSFKDMMDGAGYDRHGDYEWLYWVIVVLLVVCIVYFAVRMTADILGKDNALTGKKPYLIAIPALPTIIVAIASIVNANYSYTDHSGMWADSNSIWADGAPLMYIELTLLAVVVALEVVKYVLAQRDQ